MRFEITTRDPKDVGRIAQLLRDHGIARVNVTDTGKDVDPVAIALALRAEVPGLDVMVHAAAKHYHPHAFRSLLFRFEDGALEPVLVVSGHPRAEFDSLAALAIMSAAGGRMAASCVYNPFGPAEGMAEEHARLVKKLSYPFVKSVCLQIGMDAGRLAEAVARIRSARADVAVLGSVPVPTEGMVRRLKERPLFGVRLDERVLVSAKAATDATRAHLEVLRRLDVEPLFFMDAFEKDRIETALAL